MADHLSRQARKSSKKPAPKKKNTSAKGSGWIKKTFMILLILLFAGIVAGGITAFAIIRDAPELDHDMLTLSQNPEILDMNDEVVTTLESIENRRSTNIDDVPEVMVDAVLSIEDARFYDHFGIDIRRLGGAIVANVRSGFGSEGASTITQQVVKNLFFDFDKTITRKLQEQYLAVQLEQNYTKNQILEMYLNAIYFSDGRYGIVEASNYYFSKDLSELEIEDAALLAGIPQRPNAHNPYNNPDLAENRRNTVIDRMVHYGKITAEEGEQAKSVPVEDQLQRSERETNAYQSYIDQVLSEVEEIDGIESSDIYTGGLKIYTNLDQNLQEHVESVMQTDEYIQFPDEFMQAGITLMDTDSGQVRAIGGMREAAEGVRMWNWATNPSRQAGSTSKPIFAYGPAIDNEQWSTGHLLTDEEYTYNDEDQTPVRNFSRDFRGDITIREALRDSLNVPAVKAIHEVGVDTAGDFARGLGIPVDTPQESFALGANEVSSYEMAGAYGAFGNNGLYNEPHTVRKVEFPDGQVIDLTPEETQAMNDYTAFMVSDILKDVITNGTAARLQMGNFEVAGKTGSTNFQPEDRETFGIPADADAIPDAWFVGYSTELTASIWTGYPSANEGYIDRNNNEHHISQDIFQEVMNYAHEGLSASPFLQPDSVVEVAIEESTGLLPSSNTPQSEIITEYFVRGTEPGTVSEEFEIEEASEISNLSASYDENSDSINASWSFPEEELSAYSFQIDVAEGSGAEFSTVSTSKEMSYSISSPAAGETYTFRVTPVADNSDESGEAATVSVTVPEEEEEIEENENEINEEENNELNENDEALNENEETDNNEENSNENLEETNESEENTEAPAEENTEQPEENDTENNQPADTPQNEPAEEPVNNNEGPEGAENTNNSGDNNEVETSSINESNGSQNNSD
ncbi:transglycosylase domain-containing protein [Alkalicoccus daliensis]|uniref:Penicillin-binding protein 1A n=1 Tax=Alkalicoccus daliensis TaxID=745820 RepID=A0A1H0ASA8_9BACI|nr:PBP1A family penicillin-binding protein [Alkalicoccus daliensis]SDN36234.1 penicillin-binding protein 1A [Alkalicoccus daliensis]